MSDDKDEIKKGNIQADDESIAIGSIDVGGDISGNITIGHTIGYTADEVSDLIKEISSTFQPKPFDGRCPYKGLDVFEEEDAELFFGREKIVDDLVERVKESRTVFITGPSGSGKSSVVRAGLIPALKRGRLKNSERWLYETIKPGRDPFEALALAFSRLKSPELGRYFRENAQQSNVLNECVESALSGQKDQRLVLFFDQFEEVFTQVGHEEAREAFLNLLTHAATVEDGRVVILFAMRSDFVSNCATYPELNALLNKQFVQIGAMGPDELVSAIAQPALRVGLRIDPDLVAQIINDMQGEPGALPLMQFALKDLFEAEQAKGGVIALTREAYLQRGGIQKSLERHADVSFAKLEEHEQELARSIFSGLIEIGRGTQDTRRTALFDELIPASASAEEIEAIVRKLADARLITTDELAGRDMVTISHEKLIDAWPWLKKLVNENRDVIALQNQIATDAKEWEDQKRDKSYLYTGARLANAQEKIQNLILSESSQSFLDAGIQAEENARQKSRLLQRRILTSSLTFSVIVLGLLIFAINQLNSSRALQLGFKAQAARAEKEYNNAALYAYQSNQFHENEIAEQVFAHIYYNDLGNSLTGNSSTVFNSMAESLDGRLASASSTGNSSTIFNNIAWSPDGVLASASSDGTIIIWNLETGEPDQTLIGHSNSVNSLAWSPDGVLASASSDGTIIIWNLETGGADQTLTGHSSYEITSVAWSYDGQLASGSSHTTGYGDEKYFVTTRVGEVIIWDIENGIPKQTLIEDSVRFPTEKGYSDFDVAWSPDGRLASTSWNGTVIIWNLETGEPDQTLKGHLDSKSVNSVAWSSGGRLASASSDETIIIWNLETGKPGQTLWGHSDSVNSVAWSLDGRLASISSDGTIKIAPDSMLDADVCNWLVRNMTIDEWIRLQGPLYIYQAACPNLPLPVFDPLTDILNRDFNRALITWKGRAIFLGFVFLLLGILYHFSKGLKKIIIYKNPGMLLGADLILLGFYWLILFKASDWDFFGYAFILLGALYLILMGIYKLIAWLWIRIRKKPMKA